MKDKETPNLLLIMVVSTVILVFLYSPKKIQKNTPINFTKIKKEIPVSTEKEKINVLVFNKNADY